MSIVGYPVLCVTYFPRLVDKPSTRVQACQLLANAKVGSSEIQLALLILQRAPNKRLKV